MTKHDIVTLSDDGYRRLHEAASHIKGVFYHNQAIIEQYPFHAKLMTSFEVFPRSFHIDDAKALHECAGLCEALMKRGTPPENTEQWKVHQRRLRAFIQVVKETVPLDGKVQMSPLQL